MPFYAKEGENTTQIYSEIKKTRNLKNFSRRIYTELTPIPYSRNPERESLRVKLKTKIDDPYHTGTARSIDIIPDSWESKDDFKCPFDGIPVKEDPDWKIFEVLEASFIIKNWATKEIEAVVIYSKTPIE